MLSIDFVDMDNVECRVVFFCDFKCYGLGLICGVVFCIDVQVIIDEMVKYFEKQIDFKEFMFQDLICFDFFWIFVQVCICVYFCVMVVQKFVMLLWDNNVDDCMVMCFFIVYVDCLCIYGVNIGGVGLDVLVGKKKKVEDDSVVNDSKSLILDEEV